MKSFGELFNESWKEYKTNFKVYSVIIFLFLFIPSIIIVAAGIPLTAHIYNLDSNIDYSFLEIFKPSLITPLILIWIISLILQFFVTASFLYNSLFKKQNKVMTVKETLSGGRKYFWKVFGFSVVTAILLIFLTLAFIIPGIIFMIFWIFAAYILVNENTGIIESLKKSYYLVKGRWWRTFGFILLYFIIIIAISIAFSLFAELINLAIKAPYNLKAPLENLIKETQKYPLNILIITSFIEQIFNSLLVFITLPLGVFFLKNFYLDMKRSKKKQ